MKKNKKILRNLGGIERYHLMLENYLHTNVTMYLTIDGKLSEDILKQALDIIQKSYTLLQVKVNRRRRGTRFELNENRPLPLRVEAIPLEKRNDEIEKEVNTMLPIEEGPLARFALLRHGIKSTLIMTASHTIMDGVSGVFLLDNVLQTAAGLYRGDSAEGSVIQPAREVEFYFPKNTRGIRGALRSISLSRYFFKELKLQGGSHTPGPEMQASFRERRIQFITGTIDEKRIAALKKKADQRGVNLNSVLSAAYLIACAKDSGDDGPRTMALMTQVNLRPRLGKTFESIGNFSSSCNTINNAGAGSTLWDVAENYYQAVKKVTQTDEMFLSITALNIYDAVMRWFGNDNKVCRFINDRLSRVPQKMTLVSNVGAHVLDKYTGAPFSVDSGCVISSSPASAMVYSIIMTVNGTLSWNIVGNSPLYARARLEKLMDTALSVIERDAG